MLVAPRVLYYMAKRELWSVPVVGTVIPHTGAFPIDRGQPDREALRAARAVLANGEVLGVFVEGTRQKTGEIGNARAGASMLAMGAGVPVLPVCVRSGSGFGLPGFPPTAIAIGMPLDLSGLGKGGRAYKAGRRAHRGGAAAPRRLPAGHRPRRAPQARGAAAMSTEEQRAEEARAAAERRARREPPRARRRRGDPEVERGEAEPTRPLAGIVAVVGFPNVGKSTLVNRLAGRRETVVHEAPGVTRDRKDVDVEWNGRRFRLVDTGGIDVEGPGISREVTAQARQAVAEADLVLFVVDTRIGIGPGDEEVAAILRRAKVPTIVVANKAESEVVERDAVEFHALGLGDPVPVSGLHGTGSGDLLDLIVDRLAEIPDAARDEVVSDEIRVAILGRPNVGKSSLLNALVGAPRVIVSEVPGTTRDSIDMRLEHDGTTYRLIDTAGLRRRRKHRQEVEYWSELRAIDAARGADVALVLVDSSEGITDQDLSVADEARKAGCATLVVVSKWDINEIDLDHLRERIDRKLRQRPPVVTTSAVTRRGLERLLERIKTLHEHYTSRMPTPAVNKVLQDVVARRPPPLVGNRRLKLLYGAQVQTRPPRFRITVNDRKLVSRDWIFYLENRLREAAELEGCPVIIDLVER